MNNEIKKEETNLDAIQRINTDVLLQNIPVDELLGSVTTYSEGNDKNQTLRSSARVFKKIKLDANLSSAAAPEKTVIDKKEEVKPDQAVHKEQRKLTFSWLTDEVNNVFFEALNENGKDFESIHTYITQKLKKKGAADQPTKDNIRHLYNRNWHKISKYLKFSDGVKKTVQELYGLINYGELRKKVPTSQKFYIKLNELINQGSVTLRVKGKMVRVRTPMCPALQRLNKLNDKEDDLKLPPKVVVQLQPRNMQAFLKVQSFALNPRIKTELPLQKKLSTFISCVSKRWKAAELEFLKNNYSNEIITTGENDEGAIDIDARLVTSQLKFVPPKGAKLNLMHTEVSDFFTKDNISLKAYEERMGIDGSKVSEKTNCKKTQKARADSFSETISKPEKSDGDHNMPEQCCAENIPILDASMTVLPWETSVGCTSESNCLPAKEKEASANEVQNLSLNNKEDNLELKFTPNKFQKFIKIKKDDECSDLPQPFDISEMPVEKSFVYTPEEIDNNDKKQNISFEEQFSKLDKIRNGWTVEDCDNLSIGELYLMFGSASKLILEYYWVKKNSDAVDKISMVENNSESNEAEENIMNNFGFSDTLRKLVDIIKMQQKKVSQKCSCGHVCSPKSNSKKSHSKMSEFEEKSNAEESTREAESSLAEEPKVKIKFDDFVKPQCKPPPIHLIAQLDSIEKLKPKYTIRKGRRFRTKQLVVERELPLMPKASSGHQIVCMNIISHSDTNANKQSDVNTDHNSDAGAKECDNRNSFEQAIYMEENCNQFPESLASDTSKVADVHIAPNSCEPEKMDVSTDFLDTRSLSPTEILKENENQWISSEVADFSLSSFLGHLESPIKTDDISNDVDCQLRSLLTENSFDYTSKFADLANKVVGDTAN